MKRIFFICLICLCSCIIDNSDRSFRKATFDSLSSEKILTNDEPREILFNNEKRYFYCNELIQVRHVDRQYFQITSYFLYTIKDVYIYAKLDTFDEYIKLIYIDEVKPLTQTKVEYPFFSNETSNSYNMGSLYETENGQFLEIQDEFPLETINVQFKVDSPDENYKKMKNLKVAWKLTFGAYAQTEAEGWWLQHTSHAREWVALITNFAYIVSSDTFRTRFLASEGLYNNDKVVYDAEGVAKIYENLLNKKLFNLGVVKGYSGLGGGNTLGVAEYCLLWQYYSPGIYDTVMHEVGHCLGFGHSSNMTYPVDGIGWTILVVDVAREFINKKELFYQDYRILNTYRLDKGIWNAPQKPSYYNY